MPESTSFHRLLFPLLAGISLSAGLTPALAQDSRAQQLEGDYLGLASLGVGTAPFAVQLAIDQQDNRSFFGTALLPYIEQENIAVKGTIAASGDCTIQADSDDGRSTLKLDWFRVDGGAASLTGEASAVGDRSVRAAGPVALLRPFAEPDVDWGDGIADATFFSHSGGANFAIPIDFLGGTTGFFTAGFSLGREHFEVLGASSADQQVLVLGVSGSQVITIAGQVKLNDRGEPLTIVAQYVIESAAGKTVDLGDLIISLEQEA